MVNIGSVPYLNARPLIDGLRRDPRVSLTLATPAVLVAQVRAGTLDIAMASTFPTLLHPELHLLDGLGVVCAGPALSVRLLSRVPLAAIRTLALDASSRSSTVLAQIILADRYGVRPQCVAQPPDLDAMLAVADAAVLIGDLGLAVSGAGLLDLDLGAEWWALTGLPFCFAGWVGRDPALLAEAAPLLMASCASGLARLPAIAADEAQRLALPYDLCLRYLRDIMHYHTGADERAGLAEFRRRAAQLGLLA